MLFFYALELREKKELFEKGFYKTMLKNIKYINTDTADGLVIKYSRFCVVSMIYIILLYDL